MLPPNLALTSCARFRPYMLAFLPATLRTFKSTTKNHHCKLNIPIWKMIPGQKLVIFNKEGCVVRLSKFPPNPRTAILIFCGAGFFPMATVQDLKNHQPRPFLSCSIDVSSPKTPLTATSCHAKGCLSSPAVLGDTTSETAEGSGWAKTTGHAAHRQPI